MEIKTDHDLLIELVTNSANLDKKIDSHISKEDKQWENHLAHHFAYSILALSIALSCVGALILFILRGN